MTTAPHKGLSTRCIHEGEAKDAHGSPHTPVYNTTTFGFSSTSDLLDVVDGRREGALYTRYGLNPTIKALEAKLATLESAEAALAFASGMAAEAAVFLALGRRGVIVLGDAYGGTLELVGQQLPQLGIPGHLVLGNEPARLEQLVRGGVGVIFCETPTNPALEVFDIPALAKLAHTHGALLVVDNTFATPVNQQPLALGADLVVHSATKYLGGHSDLTAGAIMGSKAFMGAVWPWRKNLGTVPAPETAALLMRSLRTLVVRVRQQNESAAVVAQAMSKHPRVRRVLFPGLPEFPGHALAKAQMTGFGGMLSIELNATYEETARFVEHLRIFTMAPSLGGAESLVTQPVTTTHHGLSVENRVQRGISDSLVRLSIGLEDAQDLVEDLTQALEHK